MYMREDVLGMKGLALGLRNQAIWRFSSMHAREGGCPWDENTCSYAARSGHLEILKYASHEGCSWDGDTVRFAERVGFLEVLEWAVANGCPTPDSESYY